MRPAIIFHTIGCLLLAGVATAAEEFSADAAVALVRTQADQVRRVAMIQGQRLATANYALETDAPATLSLTMDRTSFSVLTNAGDNAVRVTIRGLFNESDIVILMDKGRQPTGEVDRTFADGALTFTAEAGRSYAIGRRAAIHRPEVVCELKGSPQVRRGERRQLRVSVHNLLDAPIAGSVSLILPQGWRTSFLPQRFFGLKEREGIEYTFPVTAPSEPFVAGEHTLEIRGTYLALGEHFPLPTQTVHLTIPDEPLTQALFVQAEDLAGQGGGEVTITDKKVGAVGQAFLNWDHEGHWLAWEVQAPKSGRYYLALRYCTPFEECRRALQIDGEYVDESHRDLHLAGTGGWSNDRNDWRHYVLTDGEGQPLPLTLAQGKHTVKMTNLDGQGLNLDYLALVPLEGWVQPAPPRLPLRGRKATVER